MPKTLTTGAALVLLVVLRAAAHAETEPSTVPPTTEPPAAAPPEVSVTTDVQGNVPQDMVGRWLAVCQVKLLSGAARPLTRLFEIRKGPEHLEVVLGGDVPTSVTQKVNGAANSGQPWTPTAEDLREVDQQWRPLKID